MDAQMDTCFDAGKARASAQGRYDRSLKILAEGTDPL